MILLLKYITAPVMVLMIISHEIIQFGMFELVQKNYRNIVADQINNGVPLNKQTVFKFEKKYYQKKVSRIDWKDKDEFRVDGRMYDIISTRVTDDSVYLCCILDSDETHLYSILDKLIEDDSENSDDEKGLYNYFSHFYSGTENQNSVKSFYSENQFFEFISRGLLCSEIPVTTPPPQT